ncbi:lactase-like protein [Podargus strigoides]
MLIDTEKRDGKFTSSLASSTVQSICPSLKDGANVKGCTAWSLLDKFEWNKGFSERFGFYHIDFQNKNKPPYPKASADYYKKIISANGFPNPREYILLISQISDSLTTPMEMVTEIVLPTLFTLCILISIVLLIFYLRSHS